MDQVIVRTPRPSTSLQSILFSLAFLCQLSNYTMLRDGLSVWRFAFIQKTDLIVDVKIILLIISSVAMITGVFAYNWSNMKACVVALFSIGVIIGNCFIYYTYTYYMTPFNDNLQDGMIFGYSLVFPCVGASLPCLIDYSFFHLPDNNNFTKSVATHAGFICLFWVISELFSWHALLNYQKFANATTDVPLAPLILSILAFVFVCIAGGAKFLNNKKDPPPNLAADSLSTNPHAVRDYYITVFSSLICIWIFYFLKSQLVPIWLSYVEPKVYRKLGQVVYTADIMNEQYLYFMLFAWFILKIVLFKSGGMGPVTSVILGCFLAIYTLYLSRSTCTLVEQRYTNRFVRPDYDNNKMIFMNLNPSVHVFRFSYARFQGSTMDLSSASSYFVLDRLQQHFALKRFDVSYYKIIQANYVWNYNYGPSLACHGSYNKWNCPQILSTTTNHDNITNWKKQIEQEEQLYRLDAYCPIENMYHKSSLFAYACLRVSRVKKESNNHNLSLVSYNGKRYSLLHITSRVVDCYFLPEGNYTMEWENNSKYSLINMDVFDFAPGGSYFIFVSFHDDTSLFKTYSQTCYGQDVTFYKSWQKSLTMSVAFLLPQFILMAIAEILLFTSCLQFIYARRDKKSHPFLIGFFFFFIQFGFIWNLSFPTDGYSIYNSSKLFKFSVLFLLFLLLIGMIKSLQMHFVWLAPLQKKFGWLESFLDYLERLSLTIAQRFQDLIDNLADLLALQYGMCSVESDDDDGARKAKAKERKEAKLKLKSSPRPPPPPPSPPPEQLLPIPPPSPLESDDDDRAREAKAKQTRKPKLELKSPPPLPPPPPPESDDDDRAREAKAKKTKKPKLKPKSPSSLPPPSESEYGDKAREAKAKERKEPKLKRKSSPSLPPPLESDYDDRTREAKAKERKEPNLKRKSFPSLPPPLESDYDDRAREAKAKEIKEPKLKRKSSSVPLKSKVLRPPPPQPKSSPPEPERPPKERLTSPSLVLKRKRRMSTLPYTKRTAVKKPTYDKRFSDSDSLDFG